MGVALLAGPANVIMQLARPGVGYGVLESRVESGRMDRHPIKRARTTFTYLAVADKGTDEQKAAFRRAVNTRARTGVLDRRKPGVLQRVRSRAADVGGGLHVQGRRRHLPDSSSAKSTTRPPSALFQEGIALGTMLQVPSEMWPADRAAFDRYWQESLAKVHIDDTVREYL